MLVLCVCVRVHVCSSVWISFFVCLHHCPCYISFYFCVCVCIDKLYSFMCECTACTGNLHSYELFCTISFTSVTVMVNVFPLSADASFSLPLSSGGDADGAAARGSADWRASRPAFQRQLPQPAPVHPWHAPGALEEQATSRLPGVLGGPVGLQRQGVTPDQRGEHGDVI